MQIKLSVLIPSVPERMDHLKRIVEELYRQAEGKPVEILVMLENKKRTIGTKRNQLIEQAQGEYVAFVDDDDRVAPNYIESLCAAIEGSPGVDCVVFYGEVYINGQFTKIAKQGIEFQHGEDEQFYYRKPNHLSCYAKRIAAKHKFREISIGEDDEWAQRAAKDIVHQVRVDQVLYYYDYFFKPRSWYYGEA